jgi:beta-galactosidase
VKIPVQKIRNPGPGAEFWLRVSFHTRKDSLWAKAGHEVAWQQFTLDVNGSRGRSPRRVNAGALDMVEAGDAVNIIGTNFSVTFSRAAGTLTSLKYGEHELLAQDKDGPAGPVLQIFRAQTDNDKGFGRWLGRDWREAGLSNMVRHVDSFEISQPKPGEVRVVTVATSKATNGVFVHQAAWTIRGDGSLEMTNGFKCSSRLATLPRVGIVMRLAKDFENVQWLGRGPWENYSDRKESADMGVWKSTVNEQYVPYVRPQENSNKEDVRWLELTEANGRGLKISTEEDPFSFSALHFTVNDFAATRHNYELKPREEIILSIDAKNCGLGNGSCGPGVLEKYAVPPANYSLKLRFKPVE